MSERPYFVRIVTPAGAPDLLVRTDSINRAVETGEGGCEIVWQAGSQHGSTRVDMSLDDVQFLLNGAAK